MLYLIIIIKIIITNLNYETCKKRMNKLKNYHQKFTMSSNYKKVQNNVFIVKILLPKAVLKRNSSPSLKNISQTRQAVSKGKDLLYKVKILKLFQINKNSREFPMNKLE